MSLQNEHNENKKRIADAEGNDYVIVRNVNGEILNIY